jgi:uncharacterized protein
VTRRAHLVLAAALAAVLAVAPGAVLPAYAVDVQPPDTLRYVMDAANIIPADVEARISALSARIETSTPGAQIAVVTVASLEGLTIEEYAEELFDELGVGSDELDNGVLFVIAPNEREMRIEVGYGLEGAIPDPLAGRIMDEDVLPRFADGEMAAGIEAGHARLAGLVAAEYDTEVEGATGASAGSLMWAVLFLLIPLGLVGLLVWAAKKGYLKGGSGGGSSGGGYTPPSSRSDSSSSSSWDSGSSGGGFGGFGGGGSGGGGASRGW